MFHQDFLTPSSGLKKRDVDEYFFKLTSMCLDTLLNTLEYLI